MCYLFGANSVRINVSPLAFVLHQLKCCSQEYGYATMCSNCIIHYVVRGKRCKSTFLAQNDVDNCIPAREDRKLFKSRFRICATCLRSDLE